DADLAAFREAFRERYQQREVALCEALDEEAGVGFGKTDPGEGEPSPLLDGLVLPGNAADPRVAWGPREAHLLGLLGEALVSGACEIPLEDDDVEVLTAGPRPPLPATFAATLVLAAASTEAAD